MSPGKRFRRIRKQNRIPVLDVAESVQISRSYVYQLEKDEKKPSIEVAELIRQFSKKHGDEIAIPDWLP